MGRKQSDRTGRVPVPYVSRWSAEDTVGAEVIRRRGGAGIAYADEVTADRDSHGVLWMRSVSRRGEGAPEFGKVNTLRRRHAMRRLLCQVCGGPSDQDAAGVLWSLPERYTDRAGRPNGMCVSEPPICPSCLHIARAACPALRRGHLIVRASRYEIAAVQGVRFQAGWPAPVPVGGALVHLTAPEIEWTAAYSLIRELGDCAVVDV